MTKQLAAQESFGMIIRAANKYHASLLQAAADGDVTILQNAPSADLLKAHCSSGCTILHYAAGNNQPAVVDYLLHSHEFSVNCRASGRKACGRTPLHYACRNGHLAMVQHLIQTHHADPNAAAKHTVTPLQLAIWRNHVKVSQYLVHDCQIDPTQRNDYDCGLVHWLASAPEPCAGSNGQDLIPTAEWLSTLPGIDFSSPQQQGHTALHKTAWLGHLQFCRYLHQQHGLWDDVADHAGNFAADLADMANTPKHAVVARYLREHCSRQRLESCRILGLSLDEAHDKSAIQKAYWKLAKQCHPDRNTSVQTVSTTEETSLGTDHFHLVAKAYHHLIKEGGHGNQTNPAHSLKLMLQRALSCNMTNNGDTIEPPQDIDCFQTRLLAVLLEYGAKGLDLSNVKKKWKQVWPDTPFPKPLNGKPMALSDYIAEHAGDVVALRLNDKGCLCAHAKRFDDDTSKRCLTDDPEM